MDEKQELAELRALQAQATMAPPQGIVTVAKQMGIAANVAIKLNLFDTTIIDDTIERNKARDANIKALREHKEERLRNMRKAANHERMVKAARRPIIFEAYQLYRIDTLTKLEGEVLSSARMRQVIVLEPRNAFWHKGVPLKALMMRCPTVFAQCVMVKSKDDLEFEDVQEYLVKRTRASIGDDGSFTLDAHVATSLDGVRRWAQMLADTTCDPEDVMIDAHGILVRRWVSRLKDLRGAVAKTRLFKEATGRRNQWE
jgi:hypothetical protein